MVISCNGFNATYDLLEQTLAQCSHKGLFLKFSKFEMFKPSVTVLGHVIGLSGIMPDPRKVEALQNAARPANKKVLQSFLGAASYLRRFMPAFAVIAAPLYELLAKGAKWVWSDERQNAFEYIIEELSDLTLLSALRGDGAFAIATDAS